MKWHNLQTASILEASSTADQTVCCGRSRYQHQREGGGTMTKDQIYEKIRQIVFDQLKSSENEKIRGIDDMKPESGFMSDLGADSLDVVEIVTSVEEEFDLLIPDDLLEQITTIGQAVDYIYGEL
jgi:acyl carrier protein